MLEVKRKTGANQHITAKNAAVPLSPAGKPTLISSVPAPGFEAGTGRKPSVLSQVPRALDQSYASNSRETQTKVPVITGEVHFRGSIPVDGFLSGQVGSSSGCLSVKQKPNATFGAKPELDGDISFRDMVRVNGHIAGSISSSHGTLIVDVGARVDAHIDVAVAVISGTVNGDIVAHDRVELGAVAKIHGNIWTRALTIKDGAIFEGVCRMVD